MTGASGMGLATAKIMGKSHYVIISGRTISKLQNAVNELQEAGIKVEAIACDISDRASVEKLAARANEVGKVTAVIHAAGMSPHMGTGEMPLRVNALGAIYVNEVFSKVMGDKSCILDVSSISAYLLLLMLSRKKFIRKVIKM
ncbi:SDR family NAD(P)-dependent oxidoreductase [Lacrimispora sp. 38-1]|uniref:SDR family NAD(P)-dependent oxidoreductase n=1 Tax=Lacrimispora sp. 38-1 TaxID=3125778 RepID=UPI003CEAFAA3